MAKLFLALAFLAFSSMLTAQGQSPIQRYGVAAPDKAKVKGVGKYKVTQQGDRYVIELQADNDVPVGYAVAEIDNVKHSKEFRYRPGNAEKDTFRIQVHGQTMSRIVLTDLSTGLTGVARQGEQGFTKDAAYTQLEAQFQTEIMQTMEAVNAALTRNDPPPPPPPLLFNPQAKNDPTCLVTPALFVKGTGSPTRKGRMTVPAFLADAQWGGGTTCSNDTCNGFSYVHLTRSTCCNYASQSANSCCVNMYYAGCCRMDGCNAQCGLTGILGDYLCSFCNVTGYKAQPSNLYRQPCNEDWHCISYSCGWDGYCR